MYVIRDVQGEYSRVELRLNNFRQLEFDIRNGDEDWKIGSRNKFDNSVNLYVDYRAIFAHLACGQEYLISRKYCYNKTASEAQ